MSYTSFQFGKRASGIIWNTLIGGIGATINSPALLAEKLSITSSSITNFEIIGNNINCRITDNYSINIAAFKDDVNITYYEDLENKCKAIANAAFQFTLNLERVIFNGVTLLEGVVFSFSEKLKHISFLNLITISGAYVFNETLLEELYFPNLIDCATQAFAQGNLVPKSHYKDIFMPKCTNLGADNQNNEVFFKVPIGVRIYVNSILSSNNNGSPDGDLQEAINNGAIVNYYSNNTKPSKITDLSIEELNASYSRVNFTIPTSQNEIIYYRVLVDNIIHQDITGSGQIVHGLSSGTHKFEVIAVDSSYNKSDLSNPIYQTMPLPLTPQIGLVFDCGYNEQSGTIAIDSKNGFNGNHIGGISVNQPGLIDKSVKYLGNGYTDFGYQLSINNNSTVSMWMKIDSSGFSHKQCLFEYGDYRTWGTWNMQTNGKIIFYYGTNGTGGFAQFPTIGSVPANTWTHVVLVRDYNERKFYWYINGKLDSVTNINLIQTVAPDSPMKIGKGYAGFVEGNIDEPKIYNAALKHYEIFDLYRTR